GDEPFDETAIIGNWNRKMANETGSFTSVRKVVKEEDIEGAGDGPVPAELYPKLERGGDEEIQELEQFFSTTKPPSNEGLKLKSLFFFKTLKNLLGKTVAIANPGAGVIQNQASGIGANRSVGSVVANAFLIGGAASFGVIAVFTIACAAMRNAPSLNFPSFTTATNFIGQKFRLLSRGRRPAERISLEEPEDCQLERPIAIERATAEDEENISSASETFFSLNGTQEINEAEDEYALSHPRQPILTSNKCEGVIVNNDTEPSSEEKIRNQLKGVNLKAMQEAPLPDTSDDEVDAETAQSSAKAPESKKIAADNRSEEQTAAEPQARPKRKCRRTAPYQK
ncbi:unnamed protein product, partial [Oikopleura dioica]